MNEDDKLEVFANGDMVYKIRGIHAEVTVMWDYQAPEGAKDTHFSIMRGSKSNVIIRQGKEQNYRPDLYVEVTDLKNKAEVGEALKKAIETSSKDPFSR